MTSGSTYLTRKLSHNLNNMFALNFMFSRSQCSYVCYLYFTSTIRSYNILLPSFVLLENSALVGIRGSKTNDPEWCFSELLSDTYWETLVTHEKGPQATSEAFLYFLEKTICNLQRGSLEVKRRREGWERDLSV